MPTDDASGALATVQARLNPRRNRIGTKNENAYQFPTPNLADLDSAFSVQEYLQALIRKDNEDIETITSVPEGVDSSVWQYEQIRQICLDLNILVVHLMQVCTRDTCPEMKAGEWLFLCAAHFPQSTMSSPSANGVGASPCCAIDYTVHTLNGATTLLNSSKNFPSRISIPPASQRHYPSLSRRLYRIFAHAYYHHREVFDQVEADHNLYARFTALCDKFGLVAKELRVIPPQPNELGDSKETKAEPQISILPKKDS